MKSQKKSRREYFHQRYMANRELYRQRYLARKAGLAAVQVERQQPMNLEQKQAAMRERMEQKSVKKTEQLTVNTQPQIVPEESPAKRRNNLLRLAAPLLAIRVQWDDMSSGRSNS